MTMLARTSLGARLLMAPDGITPLVAIAELTSISPPVPERGTIEVTSHDSPGQAKQFIADGTYDPGEIQIEGFYIAGTVNDTALKLAAENGARQDFRIVVKAATGTFDMIGECIVTSYGAGTVEIEGVQTFSATLKVTGAVTQAVSV